MTKINVKGPIVSNDSAWLYRWLGWDACCVNDINTGLESANGDDVVIEVNSQGGLCTAGFEMYSAIRQYEGNVEVHVINACSAATFILCAADKVLMSDAAASSLQKLNISYAKLNPDGVTAEDIIGGVDENGVRSGIELLDEVFINTGVIPAIVTAPVFSKKKEVAAALEAKVRLIGSLHNAKAYVDIDSSESGAVNVFNVAKVKEKNVPQSELIDACWPMVNKNGNVLAFSSFAAALAQAVAAENGDIPDGIDNRELLVDGVCTEDGTPVKVIQGDANSYLNANGIITAIRLPEWKAWGNNTAMYPASKDPTKRWSKCVMMLNYLQNRFKTEYLSKVGRNAKVKFIKGIVDEYNASLNALVPDYLAGGEIIFDTAKNPPSSMLEGHYIFSTRYADYTPAEYIENDFVYDAQILTDTMEGGDE